MKPTALFRNKFSVFAKTPCRGLSLLVRSHDNRSSICGVFLRSAGGLVSGCLLHNGPRGGRYRRRASARYVVVAGGSRLFRDHRCGLASASRTFCTHVAASAWLCRRLASILRILAAVFFVFSCLSSFAFRRSFCSRRDRWIRMGSRRAASHAFGV